MIYRIHQKGNQPPAPIDVSTLKAEGWSEKDLEDYLFEYLPKLVGPDLMVIGQSSAWQPEVDLLALDWQGDIWLFELKAVCSSSDNLLQVLRYSQNYSDLSIDDLSGIYEKFKKDPTRSLAVAFCEYFGYGSPSAVQEWGAKIGRKHHLVVVTDGADDDTIGAVNHWQRHGLDIHLWPYRVYAGDRNSFNLELPELYLQGRRISTTVPGIFLVNTNRTHQPTAEARMLDDGVALATSPKWMRKINRISAGSRVLLYGNGAGILAIGLATPDRRDSDLDGEPMRFVRLRDFKKLKRPIPASEARKVGEKGIVFRHTVAELGGEEGEKIWAEALARS
jgi:hypothetical protein